MSVSVQSRPAVQSRLDVQSHPNPLTVKMLQDIAAAWEQHVTGSEEAAAALSPLNSDADSDHEGTEADVAAAEEALAQVRHLYDHQRPM